MVLSYKQRKLGPMPGLMAATIAAMNVTPVKKRFKFFVTLTGTLRRDAA
jgi:hypothetical protein